MSQMSIKTADDFLIRTATNQDKDRITALLFGVLSEFGLQPNPESTDADLNDIEKNYLAAGGSFELLEDREGNLLGMVGLCPLDEETCELRKMYFVPQVRGLGLGKLILERTINHARQSGFRKITLETAGVLKGAIHLYLSFGFMPVESEHLAARCDQAYELNLQK
jgi:putative acetyltransferase